MGGLCEILLPRHRKKKFTPITYLQLAKRNVTPVSPPQAPVSPSQAFAPQIFVKEDEVVRQETLVSRSEATTLRAHMRMRTRSMQKSVSENGLERPRSPSPPPPPSERVKVPSPEEIAQVLEQLS